MPYRLVTNWETEESFSTTHGEKIASVVTFVLWNVVK